MNKVTENRTIDGVKSIGGAFTSLVKNDASDEEIYHRFRGGVCEIYGAGRDSGFNMGYKIAGLCLIVSGFVMDFIDKKLYEKRNK